MTNKMNKVRALTGGMAAIMILSNMATLTTFAAEHEVVKVAVEQTQVVPTGYRATEPSVESEEDYIIVIPPIGYRETEPFVEIEENYRISK